MLAGRRGLWVPWGLVLALWMLKFAIDLVNRGADPRPFGYPPHSFAVWSLFAHPLAAATALLLHGTRAIPRRTLVTVLGAWLALAAASTAAVWYGYADGRALDHPLVAWPISLLPTPAPLVLCGWMMLRLRRPSAARIVHG